MRCNSFMVSITALFLISTTCFAGSFNMELSKECPKTYSWIQAHAPRVYSNGEKDQHNPKMSISKPRLRKELAKRYSQDQEARKRWIASNYSKASVHTMKSVDKSNLAWLQAMLSKHGFPTVSEVGKTGVRDAWMLVQHADHDPALQKRVLRKLKSDLGSSGVSRQKYAMLSDRVLLESGKEQKYGTQFKRNGNGRLVLRPLMDPKSVDQRRASMGLMPLANYECMLHVMYKTRHGSIKK